MKYPRLFTTLALFSAATAVACSSDEPEPTKRAATLEIQEFSFDLDGDRLLSSLTDKEVGDACSGLAAAVNDADEQVSCQIVASGESSGQVECETSLSDCRENPADVVAKTSVRSTPAPIDCSVFDASLTAGCDFPLTLLEDCVNAMAQSVVPAAEAVSCSSAGELADVGAADESAGLNRGYDFVVVCADLLECETLVSVLLDAGPSDTGAGGMGGGDSQ